MAGSVREDVRLHSEGQLWLEHAPVDAIFTPVTLSGRFGELQLDAQGVWRYLLNNGAAQVQALRERRQEERFTITADHGAISSELVVSVLGSNDSPEAQSLTLTVKERSFVLR